MAAGTVIFAGQVIVGFCVSLTVTVNEQLLELFAASMTEQLTVVVPLGKVDPEAGVQFGVKLPSQLSVADAVKATGALLQVLTALATTRFAGHWIAGA